MALEKKWNAVAPQAFTIDGNNLGIVTVADTAGFKTKQAAYLRSNTSPDKAVQIKRVLSPTKLVVGLIDQKIASWVPLDISAYTVASGAVIGAEEQDKIANPPDGDHYKAIYEADPIVADRVIWVDKYGQFYDADNPLPIAFDGTIAVGNVTIQDDDGDELAINTDGSINVNIVEFTNDQKIINLYGEYSGLVSGVEQVIVSYAVPTGIEARLQRVEFSGEQIAHYRIYIGGIVQSSRRTHHGSGLTDEFTYVGGSEEGLPLLAGQLVELTALHNRPGTGNFEGRLQALEIGTAIVDNLLVENGDNLTQESGYQIIL